MLIFCSVGGLLPTICDREARPNVFHDLAAATQTASWTAFRDTGSIHDIL